MKDIYVRTIDLIYKYKQLIQDELHIPDFNEFSLEHFETCLGLLVKIEDDSSELIVTFLDRYKYLVNKKLDEIFSMKEGVSEIDFEIYYKIYYNYEFSINENEFLFYENQINDLQVAANNQHEKHINFSTLPSKYFKKGTFIWICKKIQENIISSLIPDSFKYYTKLFGNSDLVKLEELYFFIIDTFSNKVRDFVTKNSILDPKFFKEGLVSFYYPFLDAILRIKDLDSLNYTDKLLSKNHIIVKEYLNIQKLIFIEKASEIIKQRCFSTNKNDDNNAYNFSRELYIPNVNALYSDILEILIENLIIVKKLELGDIFNINSEETSIVQLNYIKQFINLLYLIIQSCNQSKFKALKLNDDEFGQDNENKAKNIILNIFGNLNKERIYLKTLLLKTLNTNVKGFVDKIVKEFSSIKNNKTIYNELRNYIDKENSQVLVFLFDSLIQIANNSFIIPELKSLFFEVDWLKYEDAITYRYSLRQLCYEINSFKCELFELLQEEKKVYEESNSASLGETSLGKKFFKQSKIQKEMLCFNIRRLNIYDNNCDSPQMIMFVLSKIFFKVNLV